MLKVWNASLVLASGTLAVIRTFLVRSGDLSSIHAFVSDPTLNVSFVALISVMVIGSIALVTWRRELLRYRGLACLARSRARPCSCSRTWSWSP